MKLIIEKDKHNTSDYAMERLINTYLPVLMAFFLGKTLNVLWLVPLLITLLWMIDIDKKEITFRY